MSSADVRRDRCAKQHDTASHYSSVVRGVIIDPSGIRDSVIARLTRTRKLRTMARLYGRVVGITAATRSLLTTA